MKISQLGEFGLIHRFSSPFTQGLPPGVLGIGDDCAIIPQNDGTSVLISTDLLIEGVHFLKHAITAKELGQKSLSVNLSDIAAMGGTPTYLFLSLGLPQDLEVSWVDYFFEGLKESATQYGVHLLGGDTTRSDNQIVVNITIMGKAESSQIKLRSLAQPGDWICVTGNLGDSAAGLKVIQENLRQGPIEQALIRAHHSPRPHLSEGQWLARMSSVHAMMDLSDGLKSDLVHLTKQSRCGARVELESLPASKELKKASSNYGWNPQELAALGGEDYCLLFTLSQGEAEKVRSEYAQSFDLPFKKIGEMVSDISGIEFYSNGALYTFKTSGFAHFEN